jgi:hypothetical protein
MKIDPNKLKRGDYVEGIGRKALSNRASIAGLIIDISNRKKQVVADDHGEFAILSWDNITKWIRSNFRAFDDKIIAEKICRLRDPTGEFLEVYDRKKAGYNLPKRYKIIRKVKR